MLLSCLLLLLLLLLQCVYFLQPMLPSCLLPLLLLLCFPELGQSQTKLH
jgi:hypothetical protein